MFGGLVSNNITITIRLGDIDSVIGFNLSFFLVGGLELCQRTNNPICNVGVNTISGVQIGNAKYTCTRNTISIHVCRLQTARLSRWFGRDCSWPKMTIIIIIISTSNYMYLEHVHVS